MKTFYKEYPTVERYIEAYGGHLEIEKPKIDNTALIKIRFSRDLVFEKELVEQYMPDYNPPDIKVEPSVDEIEDALEEFDNEYESSFDDYYRRRLQYGDPSIEVWDRNVNITHPLLDRIDIEILVMPDQGTPYPSDIEFEKHIVSMSPDYIELKLTFEDYD